MPVAAQGQDERGVQVQGGGLWFSKKKRTFRLSVPPNTGWAAKQCNPPTLRVAGATGHP